MATPPETLPQPVLNDWDRPLKPLQPLPGQVELFAYRHYLAPNGQAELFDSGRDLPGAEEEAQQILWDVGL